LFITPPTLLRGASRSGGPGAVNRLPTNRFLQAIHNGRRCFPPTFLVNPPRTFFLNVQPFEIFRVINPAHCPEAVLPTTLSQIFWIQISRPPRKTSHSFHRWDLPPSFFPIKFHPQKLNATLGGAQFLPGKPTTSGGPQKPSWTRIPPSRTFQRQNGEPPQQVTNGSFGFFKWMLCGPVLSEWRDTFAQHPHFQFQTNLPTGGPVPPTGNADTVARFFFHFPGSRSREIRATDHTRVFKQVFFVFPSHLTITSPRGWCSLGQLNTVGRRPSQAHPTQTSPACPPPVCMKKSRPASLRKRPKTPPPKQYFIFFF